MLKDRVIPENWLMIDSSDSLAVRSVNWDVSSVFNSSLFRLASIDEFFI